MSTETSPQSARPTPNRWQVAIAGVVMQMVLGTVYAWSVFKKPLIEGHKELNWTAPQVGLAFTLMIFWLGMAAAMGGKFVDKAGARKVATVSAVLFGLGTILAGVADQLGNLWILWIGYGVIGGLGNGLGYITPIAVLVRWFPDKRGLITGLAVMGFGLGAAIMGQVAPLLIPTLGIANAFFGAGALFLVILLVTAQKLNNPPEGWTPPVDVTAKAAPVVEACDLQAALRMPQFYLLWTVMFLNITAGIALVSNLSPLAEEQAGLSKVAAGTVVFVASLFNGLGRLFWASLSDRIGRKTTFLLILGTQVPLFLLLPTLTDPIILSIACCYILACYGGGFATMPAFTADTFGPQCLGAIYGKVLLAWGVAGAVGPMLMEAVKAKSGTFATAFQIAAGLLVLGLILAATYQKPGARVVGDG